MTIESNKEHKAATERLSIKFSPGTQNNSLLNVLGEWKFTQSGQLKEMHLPILNSDMPTPAQQCLQ